MIIIVQWTEKGTGKPSKDCTWYPRNSPFDPHCGTQLMWEDDTYRTSQSDDVDTSLRCKMWMTTPYSVPANQVFHVFDLLLIAICMTVLVMYSLAGCLHIQRFVSRTRRAGLQNKLATSRATWLYPSFTQQLSIYRYFLSSLHNNCMNAYFSHIVVWCKIKVIESR